MSVYFATIPDDNRKGSVSETLKERGLELLRAKPSSIAVCSFVQVAQPAYESYVQNIHAFIHATMTDTTVCTNRSMIQLANPSQLIPLVTPKLIYDYTTKLTDRRVKELTDLGSQVHQKGRKGCFLMDDPTIDKVIALMGSDIQPNKKTRHISGTMNINAFKTVLLLRNLLSAFLMTHVYPAFRTNDTVQPSDDYKMESVTKKRKRNNEPFLTSIRTCTDESILDGDDTEKQENVDIETVVPTITLQRAKPTKTVEHCWGTCDQIPNADGLFFPYVSDVALYDETTVVDVVTRYFVKTLANNVKAAVIVLNDLRSSWGILKETIMGKETSHIFKCIDIALRSQATVFPVFTSTQRYEGCVVWGAGYTLNVGTELYRPVDYNELLKQVKDNSMHSKALSDIKQALAGETLEIQRSLNRCMNIRELASIVQRCKLDVISQKEIVSAANRLCYDNRYWSCQTGFVKEAFNLYDLLDEGETIPIDVPMHPSMLFSTDKDEMVLSAFGYQAPTFLIPNGRLIKLDSKMRDEDIPSSFYMRPIELSKAVSDMKYVREQKSITNNNTNLASKHREIPIRGEDKKTIFKMLVSEVAIQLGQATLESWDDDDVEEERGVGNNVMDFGF